MYLALRCDVEVEPQADELRNFPPRKGYESESSFAPDETKGSVRWLLGESTTGHATSWLVLSPVCAVNASEKFA